MRIKDKEFELAIPSELIQKRVSEIAADINKNLVIYYLILGDKESALKHYDVLKKLDPKAADKLSNVINK